MENADVAVIEPDVVITSSIQEAYGGRTTLCDVRPVVTENSNQPTAVLVPNDLFSSGDPFEYRPLERRLKPHDEKKCNQNAKTLGRQLARAKDKLTEEKRRHATTVTEKDRMIHHLQQRIEELAVSNRGASRARISAEEDRDKVTKKLRDFRAIYDANLKCAICLENPVLSTVTTCGHLFCFICLERALGNQASCPFCKETIPSMRATTRIRFLDEVTGEFGGLLFTEQELQARGERIAKETQVVNETAELLARETAARARRGPRIPRVANSQDINYTPFNEAYFLAGGF